MYDPSLGRFHCVDPLCEYQFKMTPYAYVDNNPIRFIDPDGNFKTKFGAWWYKTWHGGGDILKDKGGQYFVSQQVKYKGSGIGVSVKRIFHGENSNSSKGSTNLFSSMRKLDSYLMRGGLEMSMKGNSGSPGMYTNNSEYIGDITGLYYMTCYAGAAMGTYSAPDLPLTESGIRLNTMIDEAQGASTSDKTIGETKTGTGEKTTSTGTSLTKSTNKNIRKAKIWIQKSHVQDTVVNYKSDYRSMQMADSLMKAWGGHGYAIDNNYIKE